LNKGKFKDLVVGDILAFALTDRLFIVRQIDFYNSFREMIVSQGVKNVVPDKDTVEEAEAVYYKFYTKEQEREFGVLAIRIEAL
jgi:ASC-1-like (ASCH) protein